MLIPPKELDTMFARLERAGYRMGDESDDEWLLTNATGVRQVAIGQHEEVFYVRGQGLPTVYGNVERIERIIRARIDGEPTETPAS